MFSHIVDDNTTRLFVSILIKFGSFDWNNKLNLDQILQTLRAASLVLIVLERALRSFSKHTENY